MRRIATILLLLLLPALYTGSLAATAFAPDRGTEKVCMLDDKLCANIDELANILSNCSFEPQQGSSTFHARNNGHTVTRCPLKEYKSATLSPTLYKHKSTIPSGEKSQKAVASSRHTHGYYIYALRHIII